METLLSTLCFIVVFGAICAVVCAWATKSPNVRRKSDFHDPPVQQTTTVETCPSAPKSTAVSAPNSCLISIDCDADAVPVVDILRSAITSERRAPFDGVLFTSLAPSRLVKHLRNFVVIDVETTGLRPASDEVIEVCAMRFVDLKPVDAFCTYINPKIPIPASATAINGIDNAVVANSPTMPEIAEALTEYIGKSNVVAHNASFDLKFLSKDIDFTKTKRMYFDTLSLSRQLVRKDGIYKLQNYKLPTVLEHFGYRSDNAHSALCDTYATGLVFAKIAMLAANVDSPEELLTRKHVGGDDD